MKHLFVISLLVLPALPVFGQAANDSSSPKRFNFHAQNTEIVQGDAGFPAGYSGPNSLGSKGQVQETATLNLYCGMRLWHGAELHIDFLIWQGYGLSESFGIEAFPNGDAYK